MRKTRIYFLLTLISLASCKKNSQQKNITQQKDTTMSKADFTTTLAVDQTPEEVFNAINTVRGWWSEEIEGSTDKLNDEFNYHYKDVHISKMKLIELIPNKKVVWLVLDNHFNFIKDNSEWKGNKIIFEITEKGNKTQLQFTQLGLVPEYECYEICKDAWTNYIQNSLRNLITTGKGQPNAKESEFNDQLLKQHNKS
ncbi:MAG: Activator of Hsp90 ATPase 1 family protein [Segetibacter sp.]|nr:Activator of Hsp90 ATPase 1 family protein [Segetibacter sp.]